MTDKRGLIIHCPVDGGLMKTNELDSQDLRMSLLFFDELLWPQNNFVFVNGWGPEYEFLVQAGVLRHERVTISGSMNAADVHLHAVRAVFDAQEAREPGCWAVNTGENSVANATTVIARGRGALVKLVNSIPVPHKDVALHDLLEFKERRRPELLALRTKLEALYQAIESAPDQSMAWNTAATEMRRDINDYLTTARESGLPWRWGTLEWGVSLSGPAAAALGTLLGGGPWESALQLATNAVAPSVAISGSVGYLRRGDRARPWKYVASIRNDLMIGD